MGRDIHACILLLRIIIRIEVNLPRRVSASVHAYRRIYSIQHTLCAHSKSNKVMQQNEAKS